MLSGSLAPLRSVRWRGRVAIDHAPAWALIPWYGDGGLGAPTLDDWHVWADWLRAHDPDDERDAEIARALARDARVFHFIARAYSRAHGSHGRLLVGWGEVRPIYDGGRRLAGFEVQPTRREMCGPAMRAFAQMARRAGKTTMLEAFMLDQVERGMTGVALGADGVVRPRGHFAPIATIQGDRWVNIPTPPNALRPCVLRQPRNPMRRGSTGAHGRARR